MVLKQIYTAIITCALLFIATFLLISNVHAKEQYTLKFATLVPPDTAWMNEIDHWADEVYKKSNGRLKFKIYPGGVMGDEPDVLRKIRSRQLQGAFFTGYGVGRIYSSARVLEMPFLFQNTDESDYVRDRLMPEIEAGFRYKGFELLGWPEIGSIHFFSKKPINSLAELKTRHIWLWQGDPVGEAFADASGVSPVPLSIIDVYTQLTAKHGSIDTVYNSAFGALTMQWHTKLSYASNISMTNAIGSLVVSNQFFKKLPEDLQQLLKTTGKKIGDTINSITRRDNLQSIALLKESGIKFSWDWNDQEKQEMQAIRDKAANELIKSDYISEKMFTRTKTMLNEFRAKQ
ncbi:MAG: TRAP transporter substrate-binding protein DctP [gamma proteobacterium symbiont of Lucinoma myriamae]|nr:TRAP transporter substrate-binding protein DctP [gamma proteobacterium symbiont of Lucinoma myriamae]MCU7818781.1 TRAP transporter substrate-binding protein DctP [gamma proteobacterium symbiont of Lucinoma myriamae]MCU7833215.1 TRAP transporter substrate-binding protein DctP [gamma proteobacterium symbiont of Lucinoma myriamae]